MEAQIIKSNDITVVRLKGYLDFEVADNFKQNCLERLNGKIVFDLEGLSFVGSSGITPFVEMISAFAQSNSVHPKFCGMTSEFKRLFISNSISEYEIFPDETLALSAFEAPLDHLVQK